MQIARNIFLILCLNILALIVITILFRLLHSNSHVFLFVLIFGVFANMVLLPLNLLSLIWPKLHWWLVAISAAWCALVFDPFSPEAQLSYGFIIINQLAFWVVTRNENGRKNQQGNKSSYLMQYENSSGRELTAAQVAKERSFSKLYFKKDRLIIKEEFYSAELMFSKYFIYPDEDTQEEIQKLDEDITWSIFTDRQLVNGFEVWKFRWYHKGELRPNCALVVLDSKGRQVAVREFDESGNPTDGAVKTFYFGGRPIAYGGVQQGIFDEDSQISFSFNKENIVEKISPLTGGWDEPYNTFEEFLETEADGAIWTLMTEAQKNYFSSADPLIPDYPEQ